MSMKKFICLFCFFLFIQPGFSQKVRKYKPIPLKELSNPKSPSYVPYPYPKNETEILSDLQYYLKKYWSNDPDPSGKKILLEAFSPDGRVRINQIIKVKTTGIYTSCQYYHLIEFEWKESGTGLCRYIQGDNGLFQESFMVDFREIHSPESYLPLIKKPDEIRRIFKKIVLKNEEAEIITEPEWIQLGDWEAPYLFITSHAGNYYMDVFSNIYIENEVIKQAKKEEKDFYFSKNSKFKLNRTGESYLYNIIEDKIIHITRIHESGEYKKCMMYWKVEKKTGSNNAVPGQLDTLTITRLDRLWIKVVA